MKFFKKFLCFLLLLFFISSFFIIKELRSTLPKTRGILKTEKVRSKVEIRRNRWGVPFIKAENIEDLFFAIGFLHAQDRLFQMELTRRMVMGRLSEIFGNTTLDLDIYQKEVLSEESINITAERINPEIKELMGHYSDGINYFIETQKLPVEFRILNYKPEKWNLKDSICPLKMMENFLCRDGSELYNYKLVNAIGFEKAKKFIYQDPRNSIIKEDEYQNFKRKIFGESLTADLQDGIGSNNWVISGKITDTGAPFLANDPHLGVSFPSYFYQIYAKVKDLELSGNTLPGAPFIVIGRNNFIGWGFTNLESDVIDYYILTINPDNENQYFWNGEWKNFKLFPKIIKVKGGKEVRKDVILAENGKVRKFGELYLLVQSVTDYPSKTVEAFLEMNFSKNYDDFLNSLKKFTSPAQNVVFADKEGNIGYFPSGLVPLRSIGDGSLPVHANSDADLWKGFLDEGKKPYLLNPEKGFIVTANNPVIPERDIPIFTLENVPSFRAERIEELIKRKEKLTIEDMKDIQKDTLYKGAEFLINKIKSMKFILEKANFVMKNLKNWDFKMDKGFAPYLFYNFEHFLAKNIFEDNIKEEKDRRLISTNWLYKIMNYPYGNEDENFFYWIDDLRTERKESFEEIVQRSLKETYDRFKEDCKGRDWVDWEEIHLIYYKHPIGSIPILKYFLNRGPYFIKGGKGCVHVASFLNVNKFRVSASSSFRMIIDFSDFSKSVIINSSGQSGNPLSKNYDDQIKLYVADDYRKMEEKPTGNKTLIITPF